MGSPDYAVPILESLNDDFDIAGVVSQPDQPVGRGRRIQSPPVKITAEELGLRVLQPAGIKKGGFMDELSKIKPDVMVVAAYGKILPGEILNFPKYGCINVHASLLPRWRGASPIQNAILAGDEKTGVTIMLMDEGVDTGDILSMNEVKIGDDDTAQSLSEKLSMLGADLLRKTLPEFIKGKIQPQKQNDKEATYTRLIKKKMD